MADEFCLKMPDFYVTFKGSFTRRKSATWDKRLYFPSEGRLRSGLNLGTKGQHATSRLPKHRLRYSEDVIVMGKSGEWTSDDCEACEQGTFLLYCVQHRWRLLVWIGVTINIFETMYGVLLEYTTRRFNEQYYKFSGCPKQEEQNLISSCLACLLYRPITVIIATIISVLF